MKFHRKTFFTTTGEGSPFLFLAFPGTTVAAIVDQWHLDFMSSSDEWESLSLFFKQTYEGGYRYLDHCGEFMVGLEDELGFFPKEGPKPTGCQMIHPEDGLELVVNANELTIRQEGCVVDFTVFRNVTAKVSEHTQTKFSPSRVVATSTGIHLFKQYDSEERSLAALLGKWGSFEDSLSDALGMKPLTKGVEFTLSSGSYRAVVKLNPASIRKNLGNLQAPTFGDSPQRKEIIRRQNLASERLPRGIGYGLLCWIDLVEDTPPPDGLGKQFDELERLLKATKSLLP